MPSAAANWASVMRTPVRPATPRVRQDVADLLFWQARHRAWASRYPAAEEVRTPLLPGCAGAICRLGEADIQEEVSEPQIQGSAAGPVHDKRQQDDGEDDDHQPDEEDDDSRDGVPGYCSRSSHGDQLPGNVPLIHNGR